MAMIKKILGLNKVENYQEIESIRSQMKVASQVIRDSKREVEKQSESITKLLRAFNLK